MNPELKEKWVKALRSGEYKQAFLSLRSGQSYCCLGVLCVVAGLTITDDGCGVDIAGKPSGYLPIKELIGHDPDLFWDKNDGGMPFPEIADYIEQNL